MKMGRIASHFCFSQKKHFATEITEITEITEKGELL